MPQWRRNRWLWNVNFDFRKTFRWMRDWNDVFHDWRRCRWRTMKNASTQFRETWVWRDGLSVFYLYLPKILMHHIVLRLLSFIVREVGSESKTEWHMGLFTFNAFGMFDVCVTFMRFNFRRFGYCCAIITDVCRSNIEAALHQRWYVGAR